MEIESRMGFRVRSKYEDVVKWIQSDPPGVPCPKNRQALQAFDSHVYAQLTASLSTAATQKIASIDNQIPRLPGMTHVVSLLDTQPQVATLSTMPSR